MDRFLEYNKANVNVIECSSDFLLPQDLLPKNRSKSSSVHPSSSVRRGKTPKTTKTKLKTNTNSDTKDPGASENRLPNLERSARHLAYSIQMDPSHGNLEHAVTLHTTIKPLLFRFPNNRGLQTAFRNLSNALLGAGWNNVELKIVSHGHLAIKSEKYIDAAAFTTALVDIAPDSLSKLVPRGFSLNVLDTPTQRRNIIRMRLCCQSWCQNHPHMGLRACCWCEHVFCDLCGWTVAMDDSEDERIVTNGLSGDGEMKHSDWER